MVIYAGIKGYLDKIDTKNVRKFEESFLRTIRTEHKDLLDNIRNEQKLTEDGEKKLKNILEKFVKVFK